MVKFTESVVQLFRLIIVGEIVKLKCSIYLTDFKKMFN